METLPEGDSVLNMQDGQIHYNPKDENHAVIDFKEYDFSVTASKKKKRTLPVRSLTSKDIRSFNKKTPSFEYQFELQKRWQLALISFVFLALGLVFGFNVHQRVSRAESVGVSVFLGMLFWICFFVFDSAAYNSKIVALIYIPNLLFLSISLLWFKFFKETA